MIVILLGVAGSGKTTIGRLLTNELGWKFYEGDDFHSRESINKMQQGFALTNADREPWLAALANLIKELDKEKQSAVIACSALKQAYRDRLAEQSSHIQFVYLRGSYDLIRHRLEERQEHYFKADLLKSQFEILEEPGQAIMIDVAQTPGMIVEQIKQALGY
jgi:gluconokinase